MQSHDKQNISCVKYALHISHRAPNLKFPQFDVCYNYKYTQSVRERYGNCSELGSQIQPEPVVDG